MWQATQAACNEAARPNPTGKIGELISCHILSGGAQAKNVFWQVSGKATLATAANFKGNLLIQTLTSAGTGAVVTGRLLAQTAVTLDATRVTAP